MALNLNIISKFNDKGIKEAQASFGGIGKTLGKLGGIVAAAFSVAAITNFAKESIAAAEGVAVANQRLDQIAKSMGIFGQQTSAVTDRLKAYAEANELNLATDAEVIKATQAKLLTFKELAQTADEAGGSFDRATAAAIDLAAAGFGTAEGNAVQLGKALNNPIKGITALTRSGITFTEAEKAKIKTLTESGKILEAQNLVLSAIETQVGGTAAATATASEKMKISFDNIREAFGAGLMPAFQGFADVMFPVFQKIALILEQIGTTISAVLVPVFEKFGAFMETSFIPFFASAADAFSNFVTGVQDGSFDLTTSISEIFERIAEMRMSLLKGITAALPGIIDAFVAFLPKIISFLVDELLPALIQELSGIIIQLADLLVVALPKLVEALLQAVPMLLDGAVTLFETLVEAVMIVVPKLITAVIDLLPKLVKTIIEMLPKILDAAIKLFTALVEALPIILPMLIRAVLDLLPEIIRTLVSMIPALIDAAMKLFFGIAEGIIKALPEIIRATMSLIPEIVSALLKAIPQLVDAAIQLLAGLAKGLIENAPRILAAAIGAVGETLVNGIKDFLGIRSPSRVFYQIGEQVGDGLILGMLSKEDALVQTAMYLANQTGKATGKIFEGLINTVGGGVFDVAGFTDDLNARLRRAGAKTVGAIQATEQRLLGGTSQQVIDALTGQATLTNPKTGMSMTYRAQDASNPGIAKMISDAIAAGYKPLEPLTQSIEQITNAINGLTTKASRGTTALGMGGLVTGPTNALIGELGPEVVYPLDRFESMMGLSNQQAGNNYNITINAGVGSDPVSIGRYVTDAIKRYESVSGKVFASAR